MRRPIDRPAVVTGDTATHAAYGVGPATDYALPRGAWVIAPWDMTLTPWRSSTGGWSLSGGGCEFQHLISSSRRSGFVREGTPIAQIAGAQDSPGSAWTGPHLHTWVTAGHRHSFEEYVASLGFLPAALGDTAAPTLTSASGGGTRPIRRSKTMSTLYHRSGSSPALYALAGESPGTPANWLETTDYKGLAVPWANVHGKAVSLTPASWDDFRARHLAPLSTGVGEVTVATDPAVLERLDSIEAAILKPRTITS